MTPGDAENRATGRRLGKRRRPVLSPSQGEALEPVPPPTHRPAHRPDQQQRNTHDQQNHADPEQQPDPEHQPQDQQQRTDNDHGVFVSTFDPDGDTVSAAIASVFDRYGVDVPSGLTSAYLETACPPPQLHPV
jgi:hypothetical protein